MDRITRRFQRKRKSGYATTHDFTTFDFVFKESDELTSYLASVFIGGADLSKSQSASKSEALMLQQEEVKNSDVCTIAEHSNYMGKSREQHKIAQNYFLKTDPYTIAVEVPVWSDKEDMCGFIDHIRLKEKVLFLLDFKPDAHRERARDVLTQLRNYKCMLKERIPKLPFKIVCGYYDHRHFYKLIT